LSTEQVDPFAMKYLRKILKSRLNPKKSALLLAASAVLAASPVQAGPPDAKLISPTEPAPQAGGAYLALFGGANVSQTADGKFTFDVPVGFTDTSKVAGSPSGANFVNDVKSNVGFVVGIKAGYEFQTPCIFKPAIEFEGFYSHLSTTVNSHPSNNKTLSGLANRDTDGDETTETTPDNLVPPSKVSALIHDNIQAGVFMLNAIGKIDLGRFRPYLGAGIGLAYVEHDSLIAPIGSEFGALELPARSNSPSDLAHPPQAVVNLNGGNSHGVFRTSGPSEVTLAYQGIAGVDYKVTDKIAVFAEYKALFFYDGPYYHNLLNNIVIAGVKVGF
jgi:opacity protein-like surface antigen